MGLRVMNYIKSKGLNFLKDALWFYTLFAILCKSIILLSFVLNESHSKIDLSKAFVFGPNMGIYFSFIIVLLAFSFLFKNKGRMWYVISINFVVSILFIFDLWYYRGYGTFLSVHQLNQASNLDNLSDSILSMARSIDIIFIIDIVLLVTFTILNKKVYSKVNKNLFAFILLLILSISYITFVHYKVDIWEEGKKEVFLRICWTPNQTISNISPIGYHIYDTYTYWQESKQIVLKKEDEEKIANWFEAKKENLPDNKYKSIFKDKNLIFIQVESLENFVVKQKIDNQEITPNLNKLLKNSLYFTDFYEQVSNGTSSDADLMANTSVYPIKRGSTFFRYPYNTYNSLPVMLKELGYSTLAAHPDKGAYWNWMEALKSFGFEKCIDDSNFIKDESIGLGISDRSYLRQLEPLIVQQKQPFYTFFVTLTSHGPFDLPQEYRTLNINKKLDETKMGGYFQSIHYTDDEIGKFISKLKEDGILDNTVLVIYGDHTGVHKYYADELEGIECAESWWEGNNLRVPFIIYNSGIQGEEIKTSGGQIDMLPTVAYLMGIDDKKLENTAMGRNLLKTKKDFAISANREYIGTKIDEKTTEHDLEGLDIADLIIGSDYFSTKKP